MNEVTNLALLTHLFGQINVNITDITESPEGYYIFYLNALDEDIYKILRGHRAFKRDHPNISDWEYAPGIFRKEFRSIDLVQWYYVCREPASEFYFYNRCLKSGYFRRNQQ